MARLIYYDYTDLVEPFGLDEAWADVTGSLSLFGGNAIRVAKEISERVKFELGLTVSIGVSWNKVFAKLGSDTDSGDGIVDITPDNYRDVAWGLLVRDLIYVGAATEKRLLSSGYRTIGDLAHVGDCFLTKRFGKLGQMLRAFARGEDASPVRVMDREKADVEYDIKGIGSRLTAPHDLVCESDAKALVWLLTESVSQRLRESCCRCRTVHIGVRRAGDLSGCTRQRTFNAPTCLAREIAGVAMDLLRENQPLDEDHAIQAIHMRVTKLSPMSEPVQYDLFGDAEGVARLEYLNFSIDALWHRFGNACVRRGVELTDEVMSGLDIKRDNTVRPVGFLR